MVKITTLKMSICSASKCDCSQALLDQADFPAEREWTLDLHDFILFSFFFFLSQFVDSNKILGKTLFKEKKKLT